jgi:Na+/phosphate symporter
MSLTLPRLTADGLRNGILEMCAIGTEMLRLTRDAFLQHSPEGFDKVGSLGRELHFREKRLTDHVALQLREMPWSLGPAEHLAFAPASLERIGDSIEALARCLRGIHQDGIPFSERACTEILTLFTRGDELLSELTLAVRTGDRTILPRIQAAGIAFRTFCDEAAAHHQERLLRGACAPRASSLFFAMLDYFREIERYTRRVSADFEKTLPAQQSAA